MTPTPGPVRTLVNIQPEPEGALTAASSGSLYVDLRGTIELLRDEAYVRVGQFETAIFLLPDLAAVADAMARLRDGALRIEAVLLEAPPLRFARFRRDPRLVELRYAADVVTGIPVDELDRAFADAVEQLFLWLLSVRPVEGVDAGSMQYVDVIASVWREIDPLVAPWRRGARRR